MATLPEIGKGSQAGSHRKQYECIVEEEYTED